MNLKTIEIIQDMIDVYLDLLTGLEVYFGDMEYEEELVKYDNFLRAVEFIEKTGLELDLHKQKIMNAKEWNRKKKLIKKGGLY